MEGFRDKETWAVREGWSVCGGGDFVLFDAPRTSGTFTFELRRRSSRWGLGSWAGVKWFFKYIDTADFVLFRIDKNTLYQKIVSKGREGKEEKLAPHGINRDILRIQIDVSPDRIVHQIHDGKTWKPIHEWQSAGADSGRFGFHVGKGEEVWLRNFKFRPAQ
jgi:hypothetical protein